MIMLSMLYIIIIFSSSVLLIISVFTKNKNFILFFSVVLLFIANIPFVTQFNQDYFGFGGSWAFFVLVLVFLLIKFPVGINKIPSHLLDQRGLMLLISMILVLVSTLLSTDVVASLKAILNLIILVIIGWVIFGYIIKYFSDYRSIVVVITNAFGAINLVIVLSAIFFAGPMVLSQSTGDVQSKISIFGLSVYRLQAEGLNATGVGVSSAISLFWLYSILKKKPIIFVSKSLIILFILISVVALLWAGSRGALIAFFATSMIGSIFLLLKNKRKKKDVINAAFYSGVIIYFIFYGFYGIFFRGVDSVTTSSIADIFMESRINLYDDWIVAKLLTPTFFGHGYGILSTGGDGINIESFFLRAFIELGIFGSISYIFTFFMLTVCVIKVDLYYYKLGDHSALFPSSIFIFTWANSISSWGFILPTGTLAIYLAIASTSAYIWRKLNYHLLK